MNLKIEKSSFDFLRDLKENNDRDWFNMNKERYLREHGKLIHFAEALLQQMNIHDVIETESGKKSLHRIYRDIRFSKDKTPYHTHWGGGFKRASKFRRGSYYFHIEPGNSFCAGGFWGPNAEDLKRIRDEFLIDPSEIRKILSSKRFREIFGSLQGEQLKTAPRGFQLNDEALDLIKYKQFLLIKRFSDREVLSSQFLSQLNETFKCMRPFLDYMSDVLTTDLNGEKIK